MKKRTRRNNDVNALNPFLESLLGNDGEDFVTKNKRAFEDSIVRQLCEAAGYPPKAMKELQNQNKWLTVDSVSFLFENVDLNMSLDETTNCKLHEAWNKSTGQLLKYFKDDDDLLILNDCTTKQNRGTALYRTSEMLTMMHVEPGTRMCVIGLEDDQQLIVGLPYDMFRLLVNSGLLGEYEEEHDIGT